MEGFQKQYRLLPMKSQTGDWEVYNTKTGETLETLRGYETRGAAADAVYDKYAEQGIGFNLRPADPDAPEKPLTQRERLAKNIKAAPAEQPAVYQVINKKTGKVIDNGTRGTKSSLGKYLRNYEKEHNIPQGDLILKLVPDQDKLSDDPNDIPRTWQYINNTTGQVIASHPDLTLAQAEETKRRYSERYDVSMRTVPTDASQQRYNDRQESNPVSEQPPEGFSTQRPSTGDYYEVRGGNDRVYGYLPNPSSNDQALAARRYVDNLTDTNGAYVQYRAGDPVQATAPNGVPMWEVYERDSGHVVHTFADHDQTSARATGQGWLRGIGAEDPSLFSVRPVMTT
jgi:hypothetical protein